MYRDISTWKEESLEKLRLDDKEKSAKEFRAIQSWLRVDEQDQPNIFESVAALGSRYPGTCSWVLMDSKIKSWLQQTPQTPMLWLSGTAGTGKSVISTQIVNFKKTSPDVHVLCHFCANTSPSSSEYDQVLKSLLEQLLRKDGDLAAHVYYEYVLKKHLANTSMLEQLLQNLSISASSRINNPTFVWIVLDGVDELRDHSPNVQARLLSFMKQLVSKTSASGNVVCKVLISSRPSTTLSHVLRRMPTISLTEEKNSLEKAIQEYASQRLRSLHTRFQQLGMDDGELNTIGLQISQKADGKYSVPYSVRNVYCDLREIS